MAPFSVFRLHAVGCVGIQGTVSKPHSVEAIVNVAEHDPS